MRKNFFKNDDLGGPFLNKALSGGAGNDPDNDSDSNGKINGEVEREKFTFKDSNELPYIVGNVDSKTKGYERFADFLVIEFGPVRNSIKLNTLNSKVFRI
jgi:hypothetical protein